MIASHRRTKHPGRVHTSEMSSLRTRIEVLLHGRASVLAVRILLAGLLLALLALTFMAYLGPDMLLEIANLQLCL